MLRTNNINLVKLLRVDPDEKVRCAHCDRWIKNHAVMVRWYDTDDRLEELLAFCSHGCAMAYMMRQTATAQKEIVA